MHCEEEKEKKTLKTELCGAIPINLQKMQFKNWNNFKI